MIQLPEKLTAAKLAEIAKMNPAVAAEIKKLMTRKHTRKVNYWVHPAPWKLNLAEGTAYTFYAPNGNQLSTRMVSESTLGARNDGVNYHVAEDTPPMPAGTWVIEFEYFLGKPCIDLHHVTAPALPT